MNRLLRVVFLCSLVSSFSAFAYSPIQQDYRSTRTVGMGGVRFTTGLYEENFFGNPARSADNPEFRLQLLKTTAETSAGSLDSLKNLSGRTDGASGFAGVVGEPLYARIQMIPLAVHFRNFLTDKWSMGAGLYFSGSTNPSLSQSGAVDPSGVFALGPVLNLSRRFLEEDRLVIGMNLKGQFRASARDSGLTVQRFLSGSGGNGPLVRSGNGVGVDADLGVTLKPRWKMLDFEYELGFSVNNVLGGGYRNLGKPLRTWPEDPLPANRTFNLGVSAKRKGLFIFDQVLFAIESSDLGNNRDGSFFRTLHMGAEAEWKILSLRTGVNQGYFTGGLGIDLFVFELNFATYGEELGLNPGIAEDRRYSLDLGFKI